MSRLHEFVLRVYSENNEKLDFVLMERVSRLPLVETVFDDLFSQR